MEADALRPAYNAYFDHITRAASFWETDALTSVSVMRAMGAHAAHLALSSGRFVISRGDVEAALGGGDARSRRAAWHLPDHRALKRQSGQWRSSCCWRR